MRITKFTATAVLAIGATAVTAGTAYAQPAQVHPAAPPAAQQTVPHELIGTDHGVGYRTGLSADGQHLVTTVDAGAFRLGSDRKTVTVADAAGHVFATLPTGVQVGDQRVMLAPSIDQTGKRLTLTPVGQQIQLKDINSQQWFFYELQRASLGALVGAIIGAVVVFFIPVVGWIAGGIVGAIVGELVAGGQPLIDSGIAYFSGRP